MFATMLMALSLGGSSLASCSPPDGPSSPALLGGLCALCTLAGAGVCRGTGLWQHSGGGMLSFAALAFAGGQMLLEAMRPPEEPQRRCGHRGLACGAADAFLVGMTLPLLSVSLWAAVGLVGGSVLLLSALGARLPAGVLSRLSPWLSAAGGLALTCVGMQLLLRSLM